MPLQAETLFSLLNTLAAVSATIGGILVVGAFWLFDGSTGPNIDKDFMRESGLLTGIAATLLLGVSFSLTISMINIDTVVGVTTADRYSLFLEFAFLLLAFNILFVASQRLVKAISPTKTKEGNEMVKTVPDPKIQPPTENVRVMPLHELEKQQDNNSQHIALKRSSKEFWLAIWKSSPYAILPLFSIAGIATFTTLLNTNPGIIWAPIIIAAFILFMGGLAWHRVKTLSIQITTSQRRFDNIKNEIENRTALMRLGLFYNFPYWRGASLTRHQIYQR
jgi:hypothetical protein